MPSSLDHICAPCLTASPAGRGSILVLCLTVTIPGRQEERPASESRDAADHDDRSGGAERAEPEDEEVEDEEDVDDFLVDEDGKAALKGTQEEETHLR